MAYPVWPEPRVFIENSDNILSVNDEVAAELGKVDKPLVVVCIVGPYRTGKSYLMNRLAGKQSGFALGSTVESKTKGIWVWLVNHPFDEDKALLLMDTEGLEDAFRSNDNFDMWICCLSILLSSMFVYNVLGKIETTTIDKLEFVSAMSSHIRSSNEPDDSDKNFDEFFPSFVLAVRDFFLISEIDGKPVTSDEYMEHMLLSMKQSKKASKQELERRDIKMKLRSYFKQRNCFCFPRPVQDDNLLKHVDTLPETELDDQFLRIATAFCDHVYARAPVKKLDHSHDANGKVLVMLARQYVSCIGRGEVPCVESAVDMVSKKENQSALETATKYYCDTTAELLDFPVSADLLADVHHECHKQAVDIFVKKAFLDRGQEYHNKLQERLLREYSLIVEKDAIASWNKCQKLLEELSADINDKIRSGKYICSGGYKKYLTDLETVKTAYKKTPEKGVKNEEALLYFLTQRSCEKMTIMKSDEALTEAQKRIKDEELRNEEVKKQLELQQKQREELEWHQAILVATHHEHLQTLNETFEQKLQEEQEEFDRLIQRRLDERKRLLEENFEKEAAELKKQIEELEERKKSGWKRIAGSVMGAAGTVLSLIPTPVTRFAGFGLTFVSCFFK